MNEYEIYQKGLEYSKRQIRNAKIDKIPVDVYLKATNDSDSLKTIMSPISNYMEIGNKETKYASEIFKFRNGSTLERTLDFLNKGEGFTRLEAYGYHIPEKGYISNFGIQVHEQSYQMSKEGSSLLKTDSVNYANMASSNYGGKPVIIEGEIPSRYVFQQRNQHEFAIPKDYYDQITNATIKDANTGDILYTYKNGQLTDLIEESKDILTLPNLEEDSIQFIEPLTWDEITASKEYKEYRKTFDFFLNKNEEEVRAFFDDSPKYNDQRLDMLEKAKKLKENVWKPYKKNAEKIGYKYDDNLTSINLSKIVTNDDIIDAFDDNIIFSLSSEAKAIIRASKSGNGITQKEIEALFRSSIRDNTVFNIFNGDLDEQLGDLKYDYHLNPKISKKFVNDESRNAFHELYKNADKLSPSQISEKINDVLKYNTKTLDTNITYNHGLIAYGFDEKNISEALQNLQNIIDNPKIQISATEEAYRLGEMGISGKGIPKMYYESDLYTKPTINGERITSFKTIEDFMESNSLYSEYVIENFQPEKLWAKEDFYKSHIDEITDIAKHFNINEIDLIKGDKGRADLFSEATYVSETIQITKANQAEINQQNLNKLSPQEAFDKYGPDDDRFYTSQGLDPKEQRAKINELNSKRKPVVSDEETLKQLHKETEEAAEQFYKTTKETEDIIKEYKQKANSDISKPKISEPKIKKPETQPIKDVNFDDILEDAAKETAEQNSKLTNRTIQNTAKKALNTKKLGIGIAVGATVLLAGAAASAANKKDKKEKKKQEKEKLKNTNNNEIDYSQDLQYAQQITNFSRGHSTYRLRG